MAADPEDFGPREWDGICLANWLATTSDQVYFKDRLSRLVRVSSRVVEAMRAPRAELLGLQVKAEADLIGKTDMDLFVEETARPAFEAEQDILRTGTPVPDVVERQTWEDGSLSYVATSKMPLRGVNGEIIGTFGFSRDITDDMAVRRQLASVLEFSPDAISRFDTQLRYQFVNPAAAVALGSKQQEIIGLTDAELGRDAEFLQLWVTALRRVLDTRDATRLEYSSGEGDGLCYYESRLVAETDDEIVTGLLVFTRDITDRKRAELALADQAARDPLTNLANRMLLIDRLGQSLLRLDRVPGTLAVLFLDLDKFKPVNDSLGHAAGDTLLRQVADRLRQCARRSDTLARFGGDEFVLLCDQLSAPEDARPIAERVIEVLAQPFTIADHVVHVSASVGIAATSDPHTPADELLRDADAAMYEAKERGRGGGRYQFFDPARRDHAVSRLKIESELRTAVAQGQLRLYYQPLHVLDTGELHGVEALVRWQHPTRGLLWPADFISVAENCDVIVAIGEWVIDEACAQLARWNNARIATPPLVMSVNVSARQLGSHRLVDAVKSALKKHAITPRLLCLEVAETALLEDAVPAPEIFTALHALGVTLALDDFGTGYSSLAHLRRYPVDILKIGQSHVRGLTTSAEDAAIVAAITAMAHALGMLTVGKGVETSAQLDQLRQAGCDEGQGYLLARPMPAHQLDFTLTDRPGSRGPADV